MSSPSAGKAYCDGPLKRSVDIVGAFVGLLLLLPLFLLVATLVAAGSGWPVLFVQERVGRHGRRFRLVKFRTMQRHSETGLPITGSGDPRVTTIGRLLRATKLDELPQLVNVIRGEMSLVGPRPEVPQYVRIYSADQRRVLDTRPGLTDPATVFFRDEESLLGNLEDVNKDRYYRDEILPRKLAMNLEYLDRASLGYDLALLLRTLWAILAPFPR